MIPVLCRCYIKPALRILFYTLYTHHLTRKLFHYLLLYDPGIILSRNPCIICALPFTLSFSLRSNLDFLNSRLRGLQISSMYHLPHNLRYVCALFLPSLAARLAGECDLYAPI
jgi:hypothetical protein